MSTPRRRPLGTGPTTDPTPTTGAGRRQLPAVAGLIEDQDHEELAPLGPSPDPRRRALGEGPADPGASR